MITAYVSSGETVVIAQGLLWQYDRGQELTISGVSLPFSFKVDFCNAGDATTQPITGTNNIVAIPDAFLLDGRPIIAFVVVPDENNERETIYKIVMPVVARPRPTDISPTPQEEEDIDSLIAAMNAAVEAAQQAAAVAGYMFFYIDENGHLIYEHTENTAVDFELINGNLYVGGAAI